MSLLRYFKKGSGSVLPSPGGPLSRHMPSSSIASGNKEVKVFLMHLGQEPTSPCRRGDHECRNHKPRSLLY